MPGTPVTVTLSDWDAKEPAVGTSRFERSGCKGDSCRRRRSSLAELTTAKIAKVGSGAPAVVGDVLVEVVH